MTAESTDVGRARAADRHELAVVLYLRLLREGHLCRLSDVLGMLNDRAAPGTFAALGRKRPGYPDAA